MYPAAMPFRYAFDSPERARILAVAETMKLPVEDENELTFVVVVPDAQTAYDFGAACFAPKENPTSTSGLIL